MSVGRKPRIVASVEARMTSKRLPGKVLKTIAGKPSLELLIERLRDAKSLDGIILATTVNAADDAIADLGRRLGVLVHRGSEHDVLSRVLEAGATAKADILVEITGDAPLVDPEIIDDCVRFFFESDCDYVSNCLVRTFPRGLAVQVFPLRVLREVSGLTNDPQDREHVSLYIYSHTEKYRVRNFSAPKSLSRPELAFTLDTPEDFELISKIYGELYPKNPKFRTRDVVRLLEAHPDWAAINKNVPRTQIVV